MPLLMLVAFPDVHVVFVSDEDGTRNKGRCCDIDVSRIEIEFGASRAK